MDHSNLKSLPVTKETIENLFYKFEKSKTDKIKLEAEVQTLKDKLKFCETILDDNDKLNRRISDLEYLLQNEVSNN